jgi:uncharacterized membrane protein
MSLPSKAADSRWPVLLALGAVVGLHYSLPQALSFGPRWLLVGVYAVFAIVVSVFHRRGEEDYAYFFGFILMGSVTAALVASLILLIRSLPGHKVEPTNLLQSAASLWISNVVLFAAWYWKLDAGGPHRRAQASSHEVGAFLFPQMALRDQSPSKPEHWHPHFIDYLFLSFNTSTALSPTDTLILSRWAKILMMVQSLVSMTIIVLLAARAVNVL